MQVDLVSSAFQAHPFPTFGQMRMQDPVYQLMGPTVAGRKYWIVTRYEDVEAVLRDKRFTKNVRCLLSAEELTRIPHVFTKLSDNMVSSDPPDHTRLRSLISMAFTPRLVEQWHTQLPVYTGFVKIWWLVPSLQWRLPRGPLTPSSRRCLARPRSVCPSC